MVAHLWLSDFLPILYVTLKRIKISKGLQTALSDARDCCAISFESTGQS